MGLLDEAIRDHLELKRRRGADPTEIAREEREALEPVFPDEPRSPALDGEPQMAVHDEASPQGDPLAEAASPHRAPAGDPAVATPPDLSTVGQETAELDMEAVLEQDERLASEAPAGEPEAAHEASADDELLDWEMPDRPGEEPPEPIPGQERLSFE